MAKFDVLIAGAGPSGCAAALSLAAFAPELRCLLVDGSVAGAPRVGEAVPPQIEPLLRHLGVWDTFLTAGHRPSYRTQSAWGSSALVGNEFLFHTWQRGCRLDRSGFDAMLVAAAAARSVVHMRAKVTALTQNADGWRVSQSDGTAHAARFVVDATGGAATLARQCGLRAIKLDRLVGCCLRIGSGSDVNEELMIETCAEGWWYTAAIPGGGRIVACMTDADRVRPLDLGHASGFARLLATTTHVRRVVDAGPRLGQPMIFPAGSRRLAGTSMRPLLCVGDASLRYDPVSGQGIVKALRSGIFAAYAIADWLHHGDARGLARYRLMVRGEFAAYWDTLCDYYAQERRWVDQPFWQRRNGDREGESTIQSQRGAPFGAQA